jgi:H+/gluconate symporter-like permease
VLGAIMERSGGADALTSCLLRLFGLRGAPLAMGLTGLILGIPVWTVLETILSVVGFLMAGLVWLIV